MVFSEINIFGWLYNELKFTTVTEAVFLYINVFCLFCMNNNWFFQSFKMITSQDYLWALSFNKCSCRSWCFRENLAVENLYFLILPLTQGKRWRKCYIRILDYYPRCIVLLIYQKAFQHDRAISDDQSFQLNVL